MKKLKQCLILPTIEKARLAAFWLVEKKAKAVQVFDVGSLTAACDAMIFATAQSVRHGQALAECVLKCAYAAKLECFGMEGYRSGRWILVDLNDVIVHVFQEGTRSFYNLEGLWNKAVPLTLESVPVAVPVTTILSAHKP